MDRWIDTVSLTLGYRTVGVAPFNHDSGEFQGQRPIRASAPRSGVTGNPRECR